MPLQENGTAPYTTASAAIAAIEAYRERGFGTPVTPETLTRAGVPESIAPRTLNSLKALELIDESGEPSPQFQALRQARGEEEYRTRLQEWIRAVYAEVLQYADPSEHSPDRVAEAFRTYEPAGQRKAMAGLLVGLWKFAGLSVPDSSSGGGVPARKSLQRAAGRRTARPTQKPKPLQPANDNSDLPSGLVGLLRQIPRAGSSWTSSRRDEFVRAFRAVLDFSVPIDDEEPVGQEDDETGNSP